MQRQRCASKHVDLRFFNGKRIKIQRGSRRQSKLQLEGNMQVEFISFVSIKFGF